MRVIDFHTFIFPDILKKKFLKYPLLSNRLSEIFLKESTKLWDVVQLKRKKVRDWSIPLQRSTHRLQEHIRYLPKGLRHQFHTFFLSFPWSSVWIESTLEDWKDSMRRTGVEKAVVVGHPPWVTNEWVLEIALEDSSILPVVSFHQKTGYLSKETLKKYIDLGVRGLKVICHEDWFLDELVFKHVESLVEWAAHHRLFVIVETHGLELQGLDQKDSAEQFSQWYRNYPETQFVLHSMNLHAPGLGIDLCEEFQNLWMDTAFQPEEVIEEAIHRLGPERILFASCWPFFGNNMFFGIQKIQNCVNKDSNQEHSILRGNAERLLSRGVAQFG